MCSEHPEYYANVEYPMDLATVTSNLDNRCFRSAEDCLNDIRLIFDNFKSYTRPYSDIFKSANVLSVLLEEHVEVTTLSFE